MKKFKEGDIVEIGDKQYEVRHTDKIPCRGCDLKGCIDNEDFDKLKAEMQVLSCVDIIPLHTHFKEIVEE